MIFPWCYRWNCLLLITSYTDILWDCHLIFPPTSAEPNGTSLPLLHVSRSRLQTLEQRICKRLQQTPAWPFPWLHVCGQFISQFKYLFGMQEAVTWLKCWKLAESLLGTWEMIAKRQMTSVAFLFMCDIFYNLFKSTLKKMKGSKIYKHGMDKKNCIYLLWKQWCCDSLTICIVLHIPACSVCY